MKKQLSKNIRIHEQDHTFTIIKGSVGTYSLDQVSGCQILYEDNKYKGNTPMFSHLLWVGGMQPIWQSQSMWCGIRFKMKDGQELYAYISDKEMQLNSLQFHEETKEAEAIVKCVMRKITKSNG